MIFVSKHRLGLAAACVLACMAIAPQSVAQTPAPNGGSTVTVTVKNVGSDEGAILGQLCPDASAFGTSNCVGVNAMTPAKKGEVQLVFTNVPQGVFALGIFHDENADGALSVMTEPMAFGNGAIDLPPVFETAALKVSGDLKTETALFTFGS